jgi:hypothetical protein
MKSCSRKAKTSRYQMRSQPREQRQNVEQVGDALTTQKDLEERGVVLCV